MFLRTLSITTLLFLSLPLMGQTGGTKINNQPAQPQCHSSSCSRGENLAAANSLPSIPVKSKWQVEDFKESNASVSCAAVKYDPAVSKPTLHLLCPGPDIFAPLRVHLALTWKDVREIPSVMKHMLVDMSRTVKFKSKPGDSKAKITLYSPQQTRSVTEWVKFTDVTVGLVLPEK